MPEKAVSPGENKADKYLNASSNLLGWPIHATLTSERIFPVPTFSRDKRKRDAQLDMWFVELCIENHATERNPAYALNALQTKISKPVSFKVHRCPLFACEE